ncbi:aspartate aminotransferase family protein [Sphingomonas sp.]|uniref:aspartate aminotransferase family protein n=1 Tax=Sphingomonas sp. TaxID=28214 RepID=UPI0035B30D1A
MTSAELRARALRVMPGGVSSNIRAVEQDPPLVLARAAGAHVWDEEGRRYIDHVCGFGAVVLGYAPPGLVAAMGAALADGWQTGGVGRLEIEAAEALVAAVPAMESCRFHGSATEAIQTALRIARAATGRRTVVKFARHYHGWVLPTDQQIAATAARNEVADYLALPWNDADAIARLMDARGQEIAAVITEPMMANQGCFMPDPGWLELLQARSRAAGALFVLDETVTGFRLALGGLQETMGLSPDLSIFGKAFAGGAPIGAVGGRRALMDLLADGTVGHGGTFNGSAPSMAAALWSVAELRRQGPAFFTGLAARGRALMDGLAQAAREAGIDVRLRGPGPIFWLAFDDADPTDAETPRYRRFRQRMRAQGVRMGTGGRWYVSAAHGEAEIADVVAAARLVFGEG